MTGKVIAVLSQKGGVSKTTTTINIAHGLNLKASSVIIDRDTQESSLDWASMAQDCSEIILPVPVIDGKSDKIDLEIDKQKEKYDYVLIDGAPRVDSATIKIIKKSDLVIIPIQASGLDLWASDGLVEIIKLVHETNNQKPKVVFLITMARLNTKLSKEILPALEEFGFPWLKQSMSLLEVYKSSILKGSTVFGDGTGKPTKASIEMNLIIDEILELL